MLLLFLNLIMASVYCPSTADPFLILEILFLFVRLGGACALRAHVCVCNTTLLYPTLLHNSVLANSFSFSWPLNFRVVHNSVTHPFWFLCHLHICTKINANMYKWLLYIFTWMCTSQVDLLLAYSFTSYLVASSVTQVPRQSLEFPGFLSSLHIT